MTDESMPKLRHSCDSVMIIERKEEKFIVFIELKSEYSNTNIRKAEKQLCASYLRIMFLLSCIENEDLLQYKKCGIIVSHPIDTKDLMLIQKKKQNGFNLSRYERQCLRFPDRDNAYLLAILSKHAFLIVIQYQWIISKHLSKCLHRRFYVPIKKEEIEVVSFQKRNRS